MQVRQGLDLRHEVSLDVGAVGGMWAVRVSPAFRNRGRDGTLGVKSDAGVTSEGGTPAEAGVDNEIGAPARLGGDSNADEKEDDDDDGDDDDDDDFLVMSLPLESRTRVLGLSDEEGLTEFDAKASPFASQRRTLAAGALAGGDLAVQVVPEGVRVAWGMGPRHRASVAVTDVLGADAQGTLRFLRGDIQGGTATVLSSDGGWSVIRGLCAETLASASSASGEEAPRFKVLSRADTPDQVLEALSMLPCYSTANRACSIAGTGLPSDEGTEAIDEAREHGSSGAAAAAEPPDIVLQATSGSLAVFFGVWHVGLRLPLLGVRGCLSLRAFEDNRGRVARGILRDPTVAASHLATVGASGSAIEHGAAQWADQFDGDAALAKRLASASDAPDQHALTLPGLDGADTVSATTSGSSFSSGTVSEAVPGLSSGDATAPPELPGLDGSSTAIASPPGPDASLHGLGSPRQPDGGTP